MKYALAYALATLLGLLAWWVLCAAEEFAAGWRESRARREKTNAEMS